MRYSLLSFKKNLSFVFFLILIALASPQGGFAMDTDSQNSVVDAQDAPTSTQEANSSSNQKNKKRNVRKTQEGTQSTSIPKARQTRTSQIADLFNPNNIKAAPALEKPKGQFELLFREPPKIKGRMRKNAKPKNPVLSPNTPETTTDNPVETYKPTHTEYTNAPSPDLWDEDEKAPPPVSMETFEERADEELPPPLMYETSTNPLLISETREEETGGVAPSDIPQFYLPFAGQEEGAADSDTPNYYGGLEFQKMEWSGQEYTEPFAPSVFPEYNENEEEEKTVFAPSSRRQEPIPWSLLAEDPFDNEDEDPLKTKAKNGKGKQTNKTLGKEANKEKQESTSRKRKALKNKKERQKKRQKRTPVENQELSDKTIDNLFGEAFSEAPSPFTVPTPNVDVPMTPEAFISMTLEPTANIDVPMTPTPLLAHILEEPSKQPSLASSSDAVHHIIDLTQDDNVTEGIPDTQTTTTTASTSPQTHSSKPNLELSSQTTTTITTTKWKPRTTLPEPMLVPLVSIDSPSSTASTSSTTSTSSTSAPLQITPVVPILTPMPVDQQTDDSPIYCVETMDHLNAAINLAKTGEEKAQRTLMYLFLRGSFTSSITPTRINFQNWKNIAKLLRKDIAFMYYFVNNIPNAITSILDQKKKPAGIIQAYKTRLQTNPEDVDAKFMLGFLYCSSSERHLRQKGYEFITAAAQKGLAIAQYHLGVDYLKGNSQRKESARLFFFTAHKEQLRASYQLGCYYETNNIDYALHYLNYAASAGHVDSQIKLGDIYQKQVIPGTGSNYKTAVEWYLKAAEQNHANAAYKAAQLYEKGLGVGDVTNDNTQKAIELYQKAAQKLHKPAAYWLGKAYQNGRGGVEKNAVLALEYGLLSASKDIRSSYIPSYVPFKSDQNEPVIEKTNKILTGKTLKQGESPTSGVRFLLARHQQKLAAEKAKLSPHQKTIQIYELLTAREISILNTLEMFKNVAMYTLIPGLKLSEELRADIQKQTTPFFEYEEKDGIGYTTFSAGSPVKRELNNIVDWLEKKDLKVLLQLLNTGYANKLEELNAQKTPEPNSALDKAIQKQKKLINETSDEAEKMGEVIGHLKTLFPSTAKDRQDMFLEKCW